MFVQFLNRPSPTPVLGRAALEHSSLAATGTVLQSSVWLNRFNCAEEPMVSISRHSNGYIIRRLSCDSTRSSPRSGAGEVSGTKAIRLSLMKGQV